MKSVITMKKYTLLVLTLVASFSAKAQLQSELELAASNLYLARVAQIMTCQQALSGEEDFLRNHLILDRIETEWVRCASLALGESAPLERAARYYHGAMDATDEGRLGDYCLSLQSLFDSVSLSEAVKDCFLSLTIFEAAHANWKLACQEQLYRCGEDSACLTSAATQFFKMQSDLAEIEGALGQ